MMMRPMSWASATPFRGQPVAAVDVVEDVAPHAHHELAAGGQVHGLDRVLAHEVVGVLHRHQQRALLLLHRRAHVLLQELGGEAALQVVGDGAPRGVEGLAGVELRQGAADLLLRDLEVLLDDLGHVELVHPRVGDRLLHVLLGEQALVHQGPELAGLVGAGGAVLVVEGDAQDLGQLLRRLLVLGGEGPAAPLVDELHDPQEVLVEDDGAAQHLGGAEARWPCPSAGRSAGWGGGCVSSAGS